jgi:hypothetical protein
MIPEDFFTRNEDIFRRISSRKHPVINEMYLEVYMCIFIYS